MPVFPVEIYIESTKIKVKLEAFNTVPCEMSPFIVNLLTRASMEAKSLHSFINTFLLRKDLRWATWQITMNMCTLWKQTALDLLN
jgi:hypothetical protein